MVQLVKECGMRRGFSEIRICQAALVAAACILPACASESSAIAPNDAGAAGSSGAGGAAGGGGGAAGAAGTASEFAHCGERAPSSACSLEATCEALDCGSPASFLDAEGCFKQECRSDSNCAADERCVPSALYASCTSGVLEWCGPSEGESACGCSMSADCGTKATCVRLSDAPLAEACNLSGLDCPGLAYRADVLASQSSSGIDAELVALLDACAAEVERQQVALGCP